MARIKDHTPEQIVSFATPGRGWIGEWKENSAGKQRSIGTENSHDVSIVSTMDHRALMIGSKN